MPKFEAIKSFQRAHSRKYIAVWFENLKKMPSIAFERRCARTLKEQKFVEWTVTVHNAAPKIRNSINATYKTRKGGNVWFRHRAIPLTLKVRGEHRLRNMTSRWALISSPADDAGNILASPCGDYMRTSSRTREIRRGANSANWILIKIENG